MSHSQEFNLKDQRQGIAALFQERVAAGLSLDDWEGKSGVSMNSAYAWRLGDRAPLLFNIVALAEAVGFELILRKRKTQ